MHSDLIKSDIDILHEFQRQSFFAKYKEVIFAIILFLILDLGVLILNYATSIQLQKDGLSINLAGRQRMLSQKLVKELYLIQDSLAENNPSPDEASNPSSPSGLSSLSPITKDLIKDINKTYDLFDSTLTAFKIGGTTFDASGTPVTLNKIDTEKGLDALEKATKLWEPLKEKLKPILLSTDSVTPDTLANAIAAAKAQNLPLLKEMNLLTVDLENLSTHKAKWMRMVQTIAIVLIILNFSFIVWDFLTKVKKTDTTIFSIAANLEKTNLDLETATKKIIQAQQETDLMFNAVRQGLFLIDKNYKIGSQYSAELKKMFRIDDLEGMSFIGILQRLLPEKIYRISRDYTEMLFDPTKKEKALITVNPLDEIEVNFSDPNGGFESKFFEFTFRRIVNPDKTIDRVFVSVRDTTKQAQLTRQLHDSEKKKERQFELLFAILHIEGGKLLEFTEKTRETLDEINQELKAEDFVGVTLGIAQDAMLRKRLDSVFRKFHTIKGSAGFIGLDYFVHLTHEIESKIDKLRNTPKLSGEDFLGVVVSKSEMKSVLDEIDELYQKLLEMNTTNPLHNHDATADALVMGIEKMVDSLEIQTEKKAKIQFENFNSETISENHQESIKTIIIQLIRNSFAHGIETPEIRETQGKESVATLIVAVNLTEKPGHLQLTFHDDGRGLDIPKIRDLCLKKEFITSTQHAELSDEAIVPYIFHPGFTTQENTSLISGRGVGLDLVSNEIINKLNGELYVNFEKNRFCEFIMEFPV